jgi:uncharacterized protein DUF4038/collagenase-like protein with putative collagen-binding domain
MNRSSSNVSCHRSTLAGIVLIAVFSLVPQANASDDLTKPIRVSPDGHFLVQPDGAPFFWLGDTAWELFHRLDRDETDEYLRDRARKGFNVIQAVATGKLDFEGLRRANRYGEAPFVDANPARPNPRYFEHIDWVVDRAARYGIRMAMLPAWGSTLVNGSKSQVFNVANAEEYGRWIARRYRGKGVIWVLGGDTPPVFFKSVAVTQNDQGEFKSLIDKTLVDYRPVYDAMAKGIIAGEGGDPFITYHPAVVSPSGAAIPRMSLYFGDRDWFDMSMLQSSHLKGGSGEHDGGDYRSDGSFRWKATFNYLPIAAEYRAKPARPVIDGEPRYEESPVFSTFDGTEKDYWRAHDARNATYHALFAGAAGHTYGNSNIWRFHDPAQPMTGIYDALAAKYVNRPWREALHAAGAFQMQFAKALLLSRPYFSRMPDQTLIVGDQGQAERHIAATRDRAGRYAMIYLPQGQPVTVDLSKIGGTRALAWWFDPRTGVARKIAKAFPTGERASFVPPTQGQDQDWILVIDSEESSFSAPGREPYTKSMEKPGLP